MDKKNIILVVIAVILFCVAVGVIISVMNDTDVQKEEYVEDTENLEEKITIGTNENVINLVNSELSFGNSKVQNSSQKDTLVEKGKLNVVYKTPIVPIILARFIRKSYLCK